MRHWLLPLFLIVIALGSTARPAGAVMPPSCLASDKTEQPREVSLTFERDGTRLTGRLFLPARPGPHPAVLFLHGGGREKLNDASLFFAPLMTRCGVAAFVYDKRGTGASEGSWEAATLDDFVQDALAAVDALHRRPEVNSRAVGVIGFSQGGRLAPLVAAQDPQVAFVVTLSAPFESIRETRLYALRLRLQQRGLDSEDLESVLALWERHLDAAAEQDLSAIAALDAEIRNTAQDIRPGLLPPLSSRLPQSPIYNSLDRDFTPTPFQAPLLALYGERDQTVPVERSLAALQQMLTAYGHEAHEIRVIPFADHSFIDRTFRRRIPIEHTVIGWVLDRVSELQTADVVSSKPTSTGLIR